MNLCTSTAMRLTISPTVDSFLAAPVILRLFLQMTEVTAVLRFMPTKYNVAEDWAVNRDCVPVQLKRRLLYYNKLYLALWLKNGQRYLINSNSNHDSIKSNIHIIVLRAPFVQVLFKVEKNCKKQNLNILFFVLITFYR